MTAPQLDLPAAALPAAGAARPRWRRPVVVTPIVVVAVVLALVGLSRFGRVVQLSAPGELPWQPGQRHLLTNTDPSDYSLLVLAEGALTEAAPGRDPACLVLAGPPGGQVVLVWPHGYRLSASGEVLRGDGSVAARVGDHVQLSGGPWGGGTVPGDACPAGDRWVVDP